MLSDPCFIQDKQNPASPLGSSRLVRQQMAHQRSGPAAACVTFSPMPNYVNVGRRYGRKVRAERFIMVGICKDWRSQNVIKHTSFVLQHLSAPVGITNYSFKTEK